MSTVSATARLEDGGAAKVSAENDPGPDQMPSAGAAGQLGRRELQDRAIRGASWTMLHTITAVPMGFVVNLILARALGVVHYGRLAFLMTLMDVVGGIIAVGVTTGTIQFGAKGHALGRHDDVRRLLSKAQGFRLFIAAPLLTLVVLLVADVPLPMLLLALAFGVWCPAFLDGATTCLAIENKTAAGAQNAMVVNILVQAATLLSLWLVGTADAVWAARLAAGGLGVGLALLVIDPGYRRAVLHPQIPVGMPAGFWRFAVPTAVGGLVATMVVSRTEVFFLAWLGDAAAVGTFALAFGLASHIFAPAQALVGPLMPAISGLREVEVSAVEAAFRRTIRASALIVSLLLVAGVPFFALLLPALYGDAYSDSEPMFVALAISAGLLVASGPVSAFVMGRLAAGTILRVNLLALIVDVGVALAVIPSLGGWGAVIANVSGALVQLVLLVGSELRAMQMPWSELVKQTGSLILAVPIAVGTWALIEPIQLGRWVASFCAIPVGCALFLLMLRTTRAGLAQEDAVAIQRALPRRLDRPAGAALRLLTVQG